MNKEKQVHYTEFTDIPPKKKEDPMLWIWDTKHAPHLAQEAIDKFDEKRESLTKEERHMIEVHLKLCGTCREKEKEPLLF